MGERLDKFLAARSGLSRGLCREAIGAGGVWLRGVRVRRLSRPVAAGEFYELHLSSRDEAAAAAPRILYEDDWLLALDKPAGMPSQGTLQSDASSALAWAARETHRELFSIHRLDAGTSGILVVAKGRAAASSLGQAFREGKPHKVYLAVASGGLPTDRGTVEAPIAPSPTPGRMRVSEGGVPARTDWSVLARADALALVAVRPLTGRTHQIRVHFAHLGAPLVGDRRYRGPSAALLPDGRSLPVQRPLLHAALLELPHPDDGHALRLEAPPPVDFVEVAAQMGWGEELLRPSPRWP